MNWYQLLATVIIGALLLVIIWLLTGQERATRRLRNDLRGDDGALIRLAAVERDLRTVRRDVGAVQGDVDGIGGWIAEFVEGWQQPDDQAAEAPAQPPTEPFSGPPGPAGTPVDHPTTVALPRITARRGGSTAVDQPAGRHHFTREASPTDTDRRP